MVRGTFENFVSLTRFQAERYADWKGFIFLGDGDRESATLRYAELDRRARTVAAVLQERGMAGHSALLLYPSGTDFVVAFFGCLYAGVVAVPAYPPRKSHHLARLLSIIRDARTRVILTTSALVGEVQKHAGGRSDFLKNLPFLATDTLDESMALSWRDPEVSGDTLAFLQYSSGTTGTPKGVMVSHRSLLSNSEFIRRSMHADADPLVLAGWLPLYHDMGLIGNTLQPVYTGGTAVFMPPMAFLQKPVRWLEMISRYRAYTSGGPNFAYNYCTANIKPEEQDGLDLSCWRVAYNGSETVRAETLRAFGEKFSANGFRPEAFYPCYGMAESTLMATGGAVDRAPVTIEVDPERLIADKQAVSPVDPSSAQIVVGCGKPALDHRIVIVDPEHKNALPERQVGEIWISGPSVALGYWGQAKRSEESFAARLADSGQGPFLRTGDLGFLAGGELFIGGRIKDLIIIRGRNYFPQDLEAAAESSHPALQPGSGAAFAIEARGAERLVIVHEVRRQAIRKVPTIGVDVIDCIREAIADQYELQVYAVVLIKTASIAKTTSGKIQRHACQANFLAGTLDQLTSWCLDDSPARASGDTNADGHTGDSTNAGDNIDTKAGDTTDVKTSIERQDIEAWLAMRIAERMKLRVGQIDRNTPFARYGMDSKDTIGLTGDLQRYLDCPIPPSLAYDHPTIASLAAYLTGEHDSDSDRRRRRSGTRLIPGDTVREHGPDEIAIIGIGCRFPGANSAAEFRRLLRNGVDAIGEIPGERWDADAFYDAHKGIQGKSNTRWGGFIANADRFDAAFFGISPREAEIMDPQQRILLEVAWQAMEQAGLVPDQLAGSQTGVFVGISSYDYARMLFGSQDSMAAHVGTGNALSIAANRLSFLWDLRGPSLAIDTACSSSLVAVHQACQSLRSGESDLAIAGGVNLLLAPDLHVVFSQAGMMSPQGRCKTFDAAANGYVRGEGAGVVILKPMAEAIADRDRILAVIKNSAINQDGRSNGLTAPNGSAQREVMHRALERAGVAPAAITYIECHGTGTALGDPIEVNSIKSVFAANRAVDNILHIGSVKTNIGHLEAAAGIAGLIKTVLALHHREVFPSLHFRQLNPHIDLDRCPIQINTQCRPWPQEPGQRRWAGVSSFGFGGTNVHVIVGEPGQASNRRQTTGHGVTETKSNERPPRRHGDADHRPDTARSSHLFTLSARTDQALARTVQQYLSLIETGSLDSDRAGNSDRPARLLADLCYSTNTTRTHFARRLGLVVNSTSELAAALAAFKPDQSAQSDESALQHLSPAGAYRPRVAFLFTGQGSQYPGMSQELYRTHPGYRRVLDQCDEILGRYLEYSLLDVLFRRSELQSLIHDTQYTQPAIVAIEYALARLWQSFGVEPTVLIGHSIGEYTAAALAGVFSLDDALRLVATRGKLMQSLPRSGEMACVFAGRAVAETAVALAPQVLSIAAINSPDQTVISGHREAIAMALAHLQEQGVHCTKLNVSHAFHSPLMEPILDPFEAAASTVTYTRPTIPIASTVSGMLVADELTTAAYWRRQIREKVDFAGAMAAVGHVDHRAADPNTGGGDPSMAPHIVIEHGPTPSLTPIAKACLPDARAQWLPTLRPGQSDWASLMQSLRTLYLTGMPVEWRAVHQGVAYRTVELPTYPFEDTRHWPSHLRPAAGLDNRRAGIATPGDAVSGHPLLGEKLPDLAHAPDVHVWQNTLGHAELAYLQDHQIGGKAVMPYAAYLEMAVVVAASSLSWKGPDISDIKLYQPLFLGAGDIERIQTVLTHNSDQEAHFRVYGTPPAGLPGRTSSARPHWTLFAEARLHNRELADKNQRDLP
ncbi:MAG: AMP-binding protein [Proteobacteria bacterium]|nr:AMP-binding protein [Pseudomonadota bacterium]